MATSDKIRSVKYAAVLAAIDNGMNAMEKNPMRGLRNMADLGTFFAQTKVQRSFFSFAQQMLGRKRSPYKKLAERTFNNVDHGLLKKLGMNLGYFSWSYGAKLIRRREAERGYNVPWSIVFDLVRPERSLAETPLDVPAMLAVIEQGREMGVYGYWIRLAEDDPRLDSVIELIRRCDDCAFVLGIGESSVTPELARRITALGNAAVSVDMNRSAPESAAAMLHEAKCMYGVNISYDADNADYILSGDFARRAFGMNCIFALALRHRDCDEDTAARVHGYISGQQVDLSADSSVFIIDFFADMRTVDTNISEQSCYIEVRNNGCLATSHYASDSRFDARTSRLSDALAELTPRL